MTSSGEKKLQLYSNHRSSCSFRVRIALNLKGFHFSAFSPLMLATNHYILILSFIVTKPVNIIHYDYKPVNLLKGEQKPLFLKLNPIGYVPALVDGDLVIVDSFALIMIFTCEFDIILKALVEYDELMNMLFSFLEPEHPHSALLDGYL
ncbi:putative glutathione transferase [Helianthus anomalus]